jgi:hypothetical protein
MRTIPALTLSLLFSSAAGAVDLVPIGLNRLQFEAAPTITTRASAIDPETGRGLVVYRLPVTGNAGSTVWARRLLASGRPDGGPFQIATSGQAGALAVAPDPQGGFAVVYITSGGRGSSTVRLWRQPGDASTAEDFVVQTGFDRDRFDNPSISCQPALGCVVAWSGVVANGNVTRGGVTVRRLDANARPVGGPVPVSVQRESAQVSPQVALAPDGRFVVGWARLGTGGTPPATFPTGDPLVRVFSATGQPLTGEVLLENEEPNLVTRSVAVAWSEVGTFLAAWEVNDATAPVAALRGRLRARLYNASGGPLAPRIQLLRAPIVDVALAWQPREDRFVVGWIERSAGPPLDPAPRDAAFAQLVAAGGQTVALPILITPDQARALSRLDLDADHQGGVWASWHRVGEGAPARSVTLAQRLFVGGSPCIGFPPVPCAPLTRDERFIAWVNYRAANGTQFLAPPVPLTTDTSGFTFTSADVPEIVAKVLDGTGLTNSFWVFYASLTDQEFSLVVEDRQTGNARVYYNLPGRLASAADTGAFPAAAQRAEPEPAATAVTPEELAVRFPSLPPEPLEAAATACPNVGNRLCLLGGLYFVEVDWQDFQGNTGTGTPVPGTANGGYFTFFDGANIELAVKLLDGTPLNGHYWVFYASMTSVRFTLRVLDAAGNTVATFENPSGTLASVADVEAFE